MSPWGSSMRVLAVAVSALSLAACGSHKKREHQPSPALAGASKLRLSPSGSRVAFVGAGEHTGLWLAPVDGATPATRVGDTKGLVSLRWSGDGRYLLLLRTEGANTRLYRYDPRTKTTRSLTPQPRVTTTILRVSTAVPERIAVTMNDRDARWPDVYTLDLATGARSLVHKNTRFDGFYVDRQLALRMAWRPTADGGKSIALARDGGWRVAFLIQREAAARTTIIGYDVKETILYMRDARMRKRVAITGYITKNSRTAIIFQDPRADAEQVWRNPVTGFVEAVTYVVKGTRRVHIALPAFRAVYKQLQQAVGKGLPIVLDRSADNARWLVRVEQNQKIRYGLYWPGKRRFRPLIVQFEQVQSKN